MDVAVVRDAQGHRLQGAAPDVSLVNRFLEHIETRAFSPATVRAYAYDLLDFTRFLRDGALTLADVQPSDLFDYLAWQASPRAVPTWFSPRCARSSPSPPPPRSRSSSARSPTS